MRRFIFWDYPRASWQYDLMVALILAFIFLTPREWFRDTPRPATVVMLPAEQGVNHFWLDPSRLEGIPGNQRNARALEIINSTNAPKQKAVLRVEAVRDEEDEVRGYLVQTSP